MSSSELSARELKYTLIEDIPKIRERLKASFASGKTRPISFRKKQLARLAYMIKDNIPKFEEAMAYDLGKPKFETQIMEMSVVLHDAVEAYNNVEKWAKTEKAPFSLNFYAMKPKIRKEPRGVVLIISPFNYPASLCLGPLAGAIAAGNAVIIKPSEVTTATSSLITQLIATYLDPSLYTVVNGSVEETSRLLDLQWDHRNSRVGRIVATAAAKHLTPCTLELGGKCPAFIDPKCDIKIAAKRIAWGKFANAGQTCTAVDYILIPKEAQDEFIEAFKEACNTFYPEGPSKSDSFSRIASNKHFDRLDKLLKKTRGTIVLGGETDAALKYIAPTVVKDVERDDPLMSEEIFGPILPILPMKDLDEAISFVQTLDYPLAIYVFSQDKHYKKKVFDNTRSGAAIANETLIHPAVDGVPFGGFGESGYGYYTGKFGFETFSILRTTIDSPNWYDLITAKRYPPYTAGKLSFLQVMLYPSMPSRDGEKWGSLKRIVRKLKGNGEEWRKIDNNA